VPQWRPERISHALFHPDWLLALHLERRPAKYVSLAQALQGEGDALTIDDATYGGMRAALLALRYGHAVSWFVNGLHAAKGLPYFPFQLSALVDNTQRTDCSLDGCRWNLITPSDRRTFRQHLKGLYMRMSSAEEICELVERVAGSLEVSPGPLEQSLRTVTSADLALAANAGVDLQNHGWSHLNPLALSETERTVEAALNEDYLLRYRRNGIRVYAPPFGARVTLKSRVSDYILLADRNLRTGRISGGAFNRCDLLLNDFATLVAMESIVSPSVSAAKSVAIR